jgi:light-regulated signal transduction histidine kinase (bacteriophytochrome)
MYFCFSFSTFGDVTNVALDHFLETDVINVADKLDLDTVSVFGVKRNAAMLRIVMENLMGNAWKFTSLVDFARIEFGVNCPAGKPVEYFVRDNGAGFDMQYANRLFGALQRLHLDDEFPGTGIGLASVQRIIHRHGGRIRAESAVGKGATFYFDLDGVQNVPASATSDSMRQSPARDP